MLALGPRARPILVRFQLDRARRLSVTVVQLSPRCRILGRFGVRGRAGENAFRFGRRLQGRKLPAGTYELRLRAPGAATSRIRVVISDSMRLSSTAVAAARRRNDCTAAQAQALAGTAPTTSEPGSSEPGSAAAPTSGAAGKTTGSKASESGGEANGEPSQNVASRSVSNGDPDEGVGIEAFAPGRLADEVPKSLLGSLLLVVAVLLLGLAALPRVVIPDPRLGRLLVARRVEVAAVGASLFFGVLLVVGLA